ncbi:dynein regulatory complex protein 9 [Antennarius striatus]|uniref:dynein regulatory complex protein 9 n=1 Tax=Antennarius striatus TaxID=241820 RepID=UPI0035AE53C2
MSLSHIQSLRLAAVLEDCAVQLDILGCTLKLRIDQKTGPAAPGLCLELQEKHSVSPLQETLEEDPVIMNRRENRELELKKQTLKSLHAEAQQKNEKLQEIIKVIEDLKHELSEQKTKIASRERIEKTHAEMQLQQVQKQNIQAERSLLRQVELLTQELKNAAEIQDMLVTFLDNQHQEWQEELQQWKQQTEEMLQQKKQQLNNVCCKRTVIADRLMDTEERIGDMEQMVMEDEEEQEKLRQLEEQIRAATKIQAWWRGCMVRRGLGSFKKEGKKKKGKKGKKKK